MNDIAKDAGTRAGSYWRLAGWGLAAGLILLPLVAMQFTSEVNWTGSDFAFAIVLIGSVGLAFELAVRMTSSWAYRGAAACALAGAFSIVWINGAVGMIGDEDNPVNLMFGAVILVALGGAVFARFRAGGMALAMLAAGLAYWLVTALAVMRIEEPVRPVEIVFTLLFSAPWFLSAALFRKAARDAGARA